MGAAGTNAGAVGFGPDPPQPRRQSLNSASQSPIMAMNEVVNHLTRAWSEWGTTLAELARDADLVMTGKGEQGLAANVAEHYGIPQAIVHFFPGGKPNLEGLIGTIAKDAEAAQRCSLGLPEETGAPPDPLEIQAYDLICFPALATESPDDHARRPVVGALTLEQPADADDEVLSWIADGTPPIYFGFGGNARLPYPAATAAAISEACAHLGERALICSGPSDFRGFQRFDNVKIVPAVNHSVVFPACRAVVHHGGAGTTAAGLRAGVPTLVLWFELEDQPLWAGAVEALKVGTGRAFSASTDESLVADLRSILTPECAARAGEVAAQMTKPADSVARTADLLEETARFARDDR